MTGASQGYVDSKVATRAPARLKYRVPPAQRPRAAAMATAQELDTPEVTDLAGSSVRSVVRHYRIPANYGADRDFAERLPLAVPTCPGDAPLPVGWGSYSTNYRNSADGTVLNPDSTTVFDQSGSSRRPVLDFYRSAYPKNGELDLYVTQLCAPVLEPVAVQ